MDGAHKTLSPYAGFILAANTRHLTPCVFACHFEAALASAAELGRSDVCDALQAIPP